MAQAEEKLELSLIGKKFFAEFERLVVPALEESPRRVLDVTLAVITEKVEIPGGATRLWG